jgi:hypothetical protein
MIRFVCNGYDIDLGGVKTLNIKRVSNVFNYDGFNGSYTLPFNLRETTINNLIFNFPSKLNNINKDIRSYDVDVFNDKLFLWKGIITIKQIQDKTWDGDIKLDFGILVFENQDKSIRDGNYGSERTWAWKGQYTQEDNFCLPMCYGPKFLEYDTIFTEDSDKYINHWDPSTEKYSAESLIRLDLGYAAAIVPMPYLTYMIRCIFADAGYSLEQNIFDTDLDLKQLIIFNNYNITDFDHDLMNSMQQIYHKIDKFDLKNNLPVMTITEFLLALKNVFNIHYALKNGRVYIKTVKEILNSTEFIRLDEIIETTKQEFLEETDDVCIGWDNADNLAQDLNMFDFTITEVNDVEDKKVDITNVINYYPGSPGLAPNFFVGQNYYYLAKHKLEYHRNGPADPLYLSISFDAIEGKLPSQDYHSYYYAKEYTFLFDKVPAIFKNQKTIRPKASTIVDYVKNTFPGLPDTANYPNLPNLVGSNYFHRNNELTTLVLLFDHGLQWLKTGSGLGMFPMASNDMFAPDTAQQLRELRLLWQNEIYPVGYEVPQEYIDNTLINKYWKETIAFLLNRKLDIYKDIVLSLTDFKNFDFTAKYMINKNLYFVDELNAEIEIETGAVKRTMAKLIPV